MADIVMALLRAIHVLGAVFWAGGTFLLAGYHEYILDPGDPERTVQRMAEYDDMSTMVGASGILAVLVGLVMYWLVSGGLRPDWVTSAYGLTITIGSLAGLASIAVAIPTVGRANNRAGELYEATRAADGLTDDQAEEVERLRARLKRGERLIAVLLAIAVLTMATAQYL